MNGDGNTTFVAPNHSINESLNSPRFLPNIEPLYRWFIVIFGAATGFGVIEAGRTFVLSRLRHQPLGLYDVIQQNFPWWYLWGLLTPVVIWLGAHIRLDQRERVILKIPMHAICALILSSFHLTAVGVIYYATNSTATSVSRPYLPASQWILVQRWHEAFLLFNVLTYGIILSVYYAIEYQKRLRHTVLEANRLSTEKAQLQQRIAEAKLQALRMELNPHFLFNTLNSLTALIRKQETTAAVDMVVRLSDLLRATLERGNEAKSPLREELRIIELYLDIQRVRYGDRLVTDIDIPVNLGGVMVPSFVLQPLVENSIVHGLANERGQFVVSIRAQSINDHIALEVCDSGRGFDASRGIVEGVGLANTRARLAHLYGDQGRLQISSRVGNGTRAVVSIPLYDISMSNGIS